MNNYTVQRVVSARGLPGINAFHRRQGEAEESYVEVPPGGNTVRSYLDLNAPDDATLKDLLALGDEVAGGPRILSLPLTVSGRGISLTFGCDNALAPAWREELRALSRYLAFPRPPET